MRIIEKLSKNDGCASASAPRERVVARLVVDEAGHDDVVAFGELERARRRPARARDRRSGAILVRDEEVDERERALARVDPADVEQVRRVAEPVGRAEPRRVGGADLDADADDVAGRIEVEPRADEIDLLGRGERERVGRVEHRVEQREAQRRLVVHGRVQHQRNAARAARRSAAQVVQ